MTLQFESLINGTCRDELMISVREEGAVRIAGGPEELVVMTKYGYDSLRSMAYSLEAQAIGIGLRDIEEGRTFPAEEVMAELKKEYGL